MNNELLTNVTDVFMDTRATGDVILRRMVISICNGTLKANNTHLSYGGYLELTENGHQFFYNRYTGQNVRAQLGRWNRQSYSFLKKN